MGFFYVQWCWCVCVCVSAGVYERVCVVFFSDLFLPYFPSHSHPVIFFFFILLLIFIFYSLSNSCSQAPPIAAEFSADARTDIPHTTAYIYICTCNSKMFLKSKWVFRWFSSVKCRNTEMGKLVPFSLLQIYIKFLLFGWK